MIKVPFNTITYSGAEIDTMRDAASRGQLSGGGHYSKLCSAFMKEKLGAKAVFLTTSCSHALELAASLLNLQPNDEVIIPSYNFVTGASSFIAKGARIVWADSREDHPNIDVDLLDQLVSPRTKALVIVHYGGVDAGGAAIRKWCDERGTYTLSELNASFLWAQLQAEPKWTQQRKKAWKYYLDELSENSLFDGVTTKEVNHNAHNFFIRLKNPDNLNVCLEHLKNQGIQALTHYRCLHKSAFVAKTSAIQYLPHCEHWENSLIRLPLHNGINNEQLMVVVNSLRNFTC
jgi:dTDP-4-amino-4,6-dideoxygalactose transaminase